MASNKKLKHIKYTSSDEAKIEPQ